MAIFNKCGICGRYLRIQLIDINNEVHWHTKHIHHILVCGKLQISFQNQCVNKKSSSLYCNLILWCKCSQNMRCGMIVQSIPHQKSFFAPKNSQYSFANQTISSVTLSCLARHAKSCVSFKTLFGCLYTTPKIELEKCVRMNISNLCLGYRRTFCIGILDTGQCLLDSHNPAQRIEGTLVIRTACL